jgi:hypothetical protein
VGELDSIEADACTERCALAPRQGGFCIGHPDCLVQRIRRLQRESALNPWLASSARSSPVPSGATEVVLDFVPHADRVTPPAK